MGRQPPLSWTKRNCSVGNFSGDPFAYESRDFTVQTPPIVLVGQPELEQRLDSPELRQLKQRVAMRCRLKPLELYDVRGYMHRSLELARMNSPGAFPFPEETIRMVHRYSRGIPRLINTICENALITGYSRQVAQITPAMVQQVAADLCLEPALISSAVNTSVPETDGREELLGVWLE